MAYAYNLGLAFEAVATEHAERAALRFHDGGTTSYRELNALSNRIAHGLQARGLRRRDVLGLFNAKTKFGFAAMLAALKLGAAYVNLDDQNPVARLKGIFGHCKPRMVAADFGLPAELAAFCDEMGLPPVALEALANERGLAEDCPPAAADVVGGDPAYIMFTSGSTGIPKGAVIAHDSVQNLVRWAREQYAITPADVLTNVNPVYFDNSVFDFYAALFNGAVLAPVPRDIVKQPRQLVAAVEAMHCTLWFSVPSMLIYLMTLRQLTARSWPAMRCIAFGGEGYPKGELAKLFNLFGDRMQLVNVYGPTECTCICSAYPLGKADFIDLNGLPPLGNIAPNFAYLVLDEDDRPAQPGSPGELCLLGPQVGLGYCNDPERTAQGFVRNPLNAAFHEPMYRTGDLVRRDDAGLLWFIGRKDNQIKHMGYRIELEEIEAALGTLSYVVQSAAVYRRVREQHGEIVAFVAAAHDAGDLDEQRIRGDLTRLLPDYMVPSRVLVMPDLPKNANGKVDRKTLLASLG